MIVWSWLEVPGVRESSSMTVAHIHWEVGVTIIDAIEFLSCHELQDVVLDNWVLSSSSNVGSCNVTSDCITPGKDVLVSFVLKSVLVDINETIRISNSSILKSSPWSAWSSDVGMSEWMLKSSSGIDVSESCDFLTNIVEVNLYKLVAKANINVSLSAFIKSNFISIWEAENVLVWSEVLDLC